MGGVRACDPDTARLAFEQIKESGALSKNRLDVLDVLTNEGRLTAGEVADWLAFQSRSNVATRLSELRDLGCVVEVAERNCKISGKRCIVWAPTGQMPDKSKLKRRPKRKSYTALVTENVELHNRIFELEKMVADLSGRLAAYGEIRADVTTKKPDGNETVLACEVHV